MILRLIKKLISTLKTLFLNGLVALLPITATIFFATFTYNLIAQRLIPLKELEPAFLQKIPGSEFLFVIFFIMLVGLLLKIFIITPIIHYFEKLIAKIPLIRTVYSSAKTVADFFNLPMKSTEEKKVVLIEFPRKGSYSMAFLLETSKDTFQTLIPEEKQNGHDFVKVFLPSSPAPTTGYFLIIPRSEIIMTDITFEEALKAIVSCGLVTPESLK